MFRCTAILISSAMILPAGTAIAMSGASAPSVNAITIAGSEERVESGMIANVDLEANQFTIRSEDGDDEVEVHVDDETQYTLDGVESSAEDALQEGFEATATIHNDVAARVDVQSDDPM